MCHDDISEAGIGGGEREGQKQTTKPKTNNKTLNFGCNTGMKVYVRTGHYQKAVLNSSSPLQS